MPENPPPSGESFNSQQGPGQSARAFLSDDQFSTLSIEVDYMEGFEPTQRALDSLTTLLGKHLNKTEINIKTTAIPAEGDTSYTTEEIRNLEERHRDFFTDNSNSTLRAYFLIVDGNFSQQNVLGIAYFNTSMAFFGKTIQDISGGIGQPPRYKVEGTVFRHEFGHNLGLVNNGTPMIQDHQDEPHGKHCTVEECVMYFAVETSDFFANLFDGTIPKFEHFGTEDMAANGGK